METIGSRLRKRRRTSPMPNEDSETTPPPPKRAQPHRGAPTRGKRGEAAISQLSVSTHSPAEPQPAMHAASPAPITSPPVVSPAVAPSVQQHPQDAPTSSNQSGQQSPLGAPPSDINAVITDIINHGETVESHYASQGYAAMGMVDTESYSQLGASLHLKLQSLPILDNLVSCTG